MMNSQMPGMMPGMMPNMPMMNPVMAMMAQMIADEDEEKAERRQDRDSASLSVLFRLKSGWTRPSEVEYDIFSAFQEEIIVQRVIHRGLL